MAELLAQNWMLLDALLGAGIIFNIIAHYKLRKERQQIREFWKQCAKDLQALQDGE